MNIYLKRLASLSFVAVILATSCTEKKTNTQEQVEIQSMDSTSRVLKENSEKLEDQTRKVEASLEKLDKEFESDNN
jgi:septal ring factor EnvC (AmiA/AmiB activator)